MEDATICPICKIRPKEKRGVLNGIQRYRSGCYLCRIGRAGRTNQNWESHEFREKLKDIVTTSFSYAQVFRKLGSNSNNTGHLRFWIKEHQIDVSHFRRKTASYDYDHQVFCKASPAHSGTVRRRILQHRLLEYRCCGCGTLPSHNGKPLVLQLDHINGISNDHRLENLRFLCPNCHSQTETFGARNRSQKVALWAMEFESEEAA